MTMDQKNNALDINQVIPRLPHRYPFLLIDRVIDYAKGEFIVAKKNVTFNEPFFQGHFPGRPIMPGVLMIEAIAQAAGILAFETWGDVRFDGEELFFLGGVDEARFRRMVEPGDQLQIVARVDRARRGIWKVKGEVTVDDEVACSAVVMIVRNASK